MVIIMRYIYIIYIDHFNQVSNPNSAAAFFTRINLYLKPCQWVNGGSSRREWKASFVPLTMNVLSAWTCLQSNAVLYIGIWSSQTKWPTYTAAQLINFHPYLDQEAGKQFTFPFIIRKTNSQGCPGYSFRGINRLTVYCCTFVIHAWKGCFFFFF